MNSLLHRQQQLQAWINQSTPFECDELAMVSGDASFRRYFRFDYKGQSIIAVDAPPEHEDAAQFIAVAESYEQCGINVPTIYAHDLTAGFYLQQDFGSNLFSDELSAENCDQMYTKALAIIPVIQGCIRTNDSPLPVFDQTFVEREFQLFTQWLVGHYLQMPVSQVEQEMLRTTFESIKHQCLSQPMVGVHRDFHSRNLMITTTHEMGVIDFQDAVVGPITYDAISLLRDSYQDWPEAKVEQWLKDWHSQFYTQYPWQQFKMWFDCVGMQRHIKVAGIFARLGIRDNKAQFLHDIPHTLNYLLLEVSQYSEFADFADFIKNRIIPEVQQKLDS